MFGFGSAEIFVVLMIALLLFGSRLPSVMRSIGQGMAELRRGLREELEDGRAE